MNGDRSLLGYKLHKFVKIAIPKTIGLLEKKCTRYNACELDESFENILNVLNKAKSSLDTIPSDKYRRLAGTIDLYAPIKTYLTTVCGLPSATNATLKMLEMITQLDLVNLSRCFCNAELPGSFIVAMTFHSGLDSVRARGESFDWIASSYYPSSGSGHLGDSYGLYENNRKKWIMGPSPYLLPEVNFNIGDITKPETVNYSVEATHNKWGNLGASLYTSDAGIDVTDDYSAQERVTALLNYGQIVDGIMVLEIGGDFITKTYTFTSQFSRSLIAMLACLFDEFYIVKPMTSRPINSEVYYVGKGFNGHDAVKDYLIERLSVYQNINPMDYPPLYDPSDFHSSDVAILNAANRIHMQMQVDSLNFVKKIYDGNGDNLSSLARQMRILKNYAKEQYLDSITIR